MIFFEVRIEYKSSDPGDRFGRGNEKTVKFSDFVAAMQSGDENLYLTTQELSRDNDGRPALISPPVLQLKHDIPLPPRLFKSLIIANINLWFGSTSK